MDTKNSTNSYQSQSFPPVVAVVGHVDHGKTSLLDAIRKTNIATREHGGITQKIGTSRIEVVHEGKKRAITFIDTPGHAAFTNMRGRGTQAADIGLLIVSLADGVQPQTKESIQLLKASGIPFIVVLTKADLPDTNAEVIKQQLLREDVLLENYGGDIPVIDVSSKTGKNIQELLDLILLVYDLHPERIKAAKNDNFTAFVIESKLDPKVGPRATLIVKNGTLKLRDEVEGEKVEGRVRTIMNDVGKQQQEASVGEGVEVLGFTSVPPVGALLYKKGQGAYTPAASMQKEPEKDSRTPQEIFLQPEETKHLSIILCADTQGSLEAIVHSLSKEVHIVLQKTGDISEADVLMAKSTGAIVLGFNIRIRPEVARLAQNERVLVKNYTIIYELIDEVHDVLEGKQLAAMEEILGVAQVLASFPYEKTKVLGVKVADGRIARGDRIRLMRGEEEVGTAAVSSVRHGRDVVSKIEKNNEAGVILSPELPFAIGDTILSIR